QSTMLPLVVLLLLLTETTSGRTEPDTQSTRDGGGGGCITKEREALLSIKACITADPERLLSTWRGQDCCRWEGVRCTNMTTSHVVKLDLHARYIRSSLEGEISSSLEALEHLQHLDLSGNYALTGPGGSLPSFIGSLHDLRYLNLSRLNFSGTVPHQFGNLSRLRYLDLDLSSDDLHSDDLSWLPRLSLLKYLDMSYVDLSATIDWVETVNMLASLEVLRLSWCSLNNTGHFVSRSNLSHLKILDISFNTIETSFDAISWVWDATRLEYLNLEDTGIHGVLPTRLANLSSLQVIQLSGNHLKGMIPDTLTSLCSLRVFELTRNDLEGDITEFIESFNRLMGSLTTSISTLTDLVYLNLGYNQMDGVITKDHFSKLTGLQELHLSANSFTINSDWTPPFRLQSLGLGSCRCGPGFPRWLKSQKNIYSLYLFDAGIADTVPDWFWTVFAKAEVLDLSSNNISGTLPATLGQMDTFWLDLSSNQFNGLVPQLPQNIGTLDLSRNSLSGPLPFNVRSPISIETLILFDNQFTGTIPTSLCQMKSLTVLDIGNNMITGQFPRCSENVAASSGMDPSNIPSPDSDSGSGMPQSMSIETLRLDNNSLADEFPLLLQNCPELTFIDLGQNKLFGSIPAWIGQKLPQLKYLRLRSNMFSGYIPTQLRGLLHLQYLDLAHNDFSGTIPPSLLNMDGVTKTTEIATEDTSSSTSSGVAAVDDGQNPHGTVYRISNSIFAVTKGQEREYIGFFIYMVSLDLSCNHFTGDIPKSIGPASGLVNMNLSLNQLTGKIPESIGLMRSLESLDLSNNQLSGEIPQGLSDLTSLSYLNLSYNNLSGRIPSGHQLGTLSPDDPASMYIGNTGLCGPPLPKSCPGNHTAEKRHFTTSKEGSETMPFCFGLSVGFVVGLWVVFCSLLFKKPWRDIYFRLLDELYDKMYVLLVVNWVRMMGKATATY
ncbi:receptor-like protein EIX2, partial [Lolium rigidum]|uniref:receptor-like protein EIX2 n=1 Tax=Lolium rigidum TaxID=89674 RepID=UPI001F5D874D